jgi:glycosyltransferase involved in cell wall biosynthesis
MILGEYKKMRIGFDARTFFGKQGGIGRYASNIIKGLISTYHGNEYVLYRWKTIPGENDGFLPLQNIPGSFEERILPTFPFPKEFIWSQCVLPIELTRRPVDLFHGLDFYIPLAWRGDSAVTVHDISWEYFLSDFALKTRYKNRMLIPLACKRAKAVIVNSNHTAKDLMNIYKVPEKKIHVIYHGVEDKFCVLENYSESFLEDLRTEYGVRRPFILSVGDLRPRKNLLRLFQAFARLVKIDEFHDFQLAIVGKPVRNVSDLYNYVIENKIENKIRFLGYLPDDILPQLYNAASLFIQPSLYEGFGFTALEALSCGAPTAVSNVSSLPEICGDGAIYFNPYSVEEITQTMLSILTNRVLRQKVRQAGLRRAKMFSWGKTVNETFNIYQEISRF